MVPIVYEEDELMEFKNSLSGGAPYLMKHQVNATAANAGVPLLVGGAGEAGLDLPTATAANNMVGVNLDTATYVTAQQTDGTSAERLVTVIINPDAVWRARLSGSATEGTALTARTVTTASTDGLAVTAGDYSGTTMDEGAIWGYSGANVSAIRKITSISTTAATVTVAFDNDIAVGDQFIHASFWPFDVNTVKLTAAFFEVDAQAAAASNEAEFTPIKYEQRDIAGEGLLKSYVLMVAGDHVLGGSDL